MNKMIDIKNKLSQDIIELLTDAKKVAEQIGYGLYLVGGPVRDILLDKADCIHDIDLALEGNTQVFINILKNKIKYEKLTSHASFNTATFIINDNLHLDIAMCRTEIYTQPAKLPIVHIADIEEDLKRRDFTINSMAIKLTGLDAGTLIDNFNSQNDLEKGIIRVLHKKSFIDDPTRLWRAIRYASRFDFELDYETKALFNYSLDNLDLLTPERLRYEFECMINEPNTCAVLTKAQEYGLLGYINEALDSVYINQLDVAESIAPLDLTNTLCALTITLDENTVSAICKKLDLDKNTTRDLMAFSALQHLIPTENKSEIYINLSGYSKELLRLTNMVTLNTELQKMIDIYLTELADLEPFINGTELKELGVQEGPMFGEKLRELMRLQIEGTIPDKETAKKWVQSHWVLR